MQAAAAVGGGGAGCRVRAGHRGQQAATGAGGAVGCPARGRLGRVGELAAPLELLYLVIEGEQCLHQSQVLLHQARLHTHNSGSIYKRPCLSPASNIGIPQVFCGHVGT